MIFRFPRARSRRAEKESEKAFPRGNAGTPLFFRGNARFRDVSSVAKRVAVAKRGGGGVGFVEGEFLREA